MSLFNIFNVSGSAMSAQSVRLNTTASNLANANSVSSSVDETYRSRSPVFATALADAQGNQQGNSLTNQTQAGQAAGVKVMGIVESDKPLQIEYAPNHPMADDKGYIYRSNVNTMEEMANMISASRSYQTNVQVADTAKTMTQRLLRLGQG